MLVADVAAPVAVVAECWAHGDGKGNFVWANARGSCWRACIGGKEGEGVKGKCPVTLDETNVR
jgi:hypothetical protein